VDDHGGDIPLAISILKVWGEELQWTLFACQGFGGQRAREKERRGSFLWMSTERAAADRRKKRPEGVLYGLEPSLHGQKCAIPQTAA
jgi:hypothetical protein